MTCYFCGKIISNKTALWTHVVFKHPEQANNGVIDGNVVQEELVSTNDGTTNQKLDGSFGIINKYKNSENFSKDEILNFDDKEFLEVLAVHTKIVEDNNNSTSSDGSNFVLVDPVFEKSESDDSSVEFPEFETQDVLKSAEISNLFRDIIENKEIEESDTNGCELNSSSSFILVDPVFVQSDSEDSVFEFQGFEASSLEKPVLVSNDFTKIIRKKEIEIECENLENALLCLAIEKVTNDAIVDHIKQLEHYLKQIEDTFTKLSVGVADFPFPVVTGDTFKYSTNNKLIVDYGFLNKY